jgi:hypothetical protein
MRSSAPLGGEDRCSGTGIFYVSFEIFESIVVLPSVHCVGDV